MVISYRTRVIENFSSPLLATLSATSLFYQQRAAYFHPTPSLFDGGQESGGRNKGELLDLAQNNELQAIRARLDGEEGKKSSINEANEDGVTALHAAVMGGFSEIVKLLVTHGANVNTKTKDDGATPLLWAMRGGSSEVVEKLLEGGADPNLADLAGVVPLHLAAGTGQTELINLLLGTGKANVNASFHIPGGGECRPLNYAIARNEVAAVKILLEAGATSTHPGDPRGMTALHVASLQGYLETVEALLDLGKDVNINVRDKQGATPLMRAVEFGRTDVVRLLLDNEADWKLTTPDGVTPLHLAAFKNQTECAHLLLGEHGALADPNALTVSKSSPLKLAIERNNVPLVELLLEKGADSNIVDGYEACPLHVAASIGAVESVKLLLKFKADPGKINPKDGNTPLSLARRLKKTEVANVLETELRLQGRLNN